MPRSASQDDGLPAVLAASRPEVERRLGVVDPEAGRLQRLAQLGPARGVPGVLLDDVVVVVEGGDHRGLLRAGHHQAEVLAYGEQLADQRRVAGDEARSGSRPGWSASTASGPRGCPRGEPPLIDGVQHRHRRRLPGALEVALVGDQDRAALAAPVDDLLQVLDGQHPAGRVGRRVEPEQRRRLRAERGQRVGGDAAGAGERRARPRTSGRRAPARRPGRPARGRGGRAARRSAPWSRSPGARRRGRARSRRAGAPASRRRPAGSRAVPIVSG